MRRIFLNYRIVFSFFACLFFVSAAEAQIDIPLSDEEIFMIRGDLQTVKTSGLNRISITNPAVADVANMDTDHLLMLARQPGETTLFIWDNYGKRAVKIYVSADDLNATKSRIEQLLMKADIKGVELEVDPIENKIIMSGAISEEEQGELEKLLEPFSANVMNLLKKKGENALVQIDAQIVELTGSYSKDLGVDWTSALSYTETLPTGTIHEIGDIFKLGKFSRSTAITSTLNALVTEGKGRVLSRPKLVVVSGKSANFLVGGQIPVTETTTSSGGTVSEDVTFKDYGIGLNIQPTIKKDNKVDIQLDIQVSDVDAGNSVGGNTAFTTRSASTQLYLDDGQTVVIAGLMKQNRGETITRIPFLSDIPIAGALFRHKKNPAAETDTELVITLTPTILKQENKAIQAKKDAPASAPQQDENEAAAFLNQRISPSRIVVSRDTPFASSPLPEGIIPYAQAIQEKIAQRIVYPERARRYGWEGTVKLALRLDADGNLSSTTIQESSGYDIFDDDAVNLVNGLSPYGGFPAETGLDGLTVTVPIVYSLDKSF